MNSHVTHLVLDDIGEKTLRNLSISPKKWTNLIADLSELCDSSHAKEAVSHLVEQTFDVVRLKLKAPPIVDSFDEPEVKRITKGLHRLLSVQQNQAKAGRVINAKVFSSLLSYISEKEGNKELLKALQSIPYINNNNNNSNYNHKSARRKAFKHKLPHVDMNFAVEFLNFVEFSMETNSLSTYLILLKLLLSLKDYGSFHDLQSVSSLLETSLPLIEALSTHSVLDVHDLRKISSVEELTEHLQTFDSAPRVLLCNGNPSKLSTYEVQGRALGFIAGLSVPMHPFSSTVGSYYSPKYFEVTLKGRGFAGVKVGWCLCGADLPRSSSTNSSLGNTDEVWVFEGYSGHFFHNAAELIERRKQDNSHAFDGDETNEEDDDKDKDESLFSNLFAETLSDDLKASESAADPRIKALLLPSEAVASGETRLSLPDFSRSPSRALAFLSSINDDNSLVDISSVRRLLSYRNNSSIDSPSQHFSGINTVGSDVSEAASTFMQTSSNVQSASCDPVHLLVSQSFHESNDTTLLRLSGEAGSKRTDEKSIVFNTSPVDSKHGINLSAFKSGGTPLTNQSPADFTWGNGSTLGCLLQPSTGEMSFFIEGRLIGVAPVNLTHDKLSDSVGVCPVFSSNSSSGLEINIGQAPFKYEAAVLAHIQTNHVAAAAGAPEQTGLCPPSDDPEAKRLLEAKVRSELPTMTSRHKGYLSINQPTADSAATSSGSGILIENFSSEALKTLTFEASIQLSEVDVVARADVSSSSSSSQEPPVHRSVQVIMSCGPTADSCSSVSPIGPVDDYYACSFGIDSSGCLVFEVFGGETVRSPPCCIKARSWYHVAVAFTYHRSSNKAAVCLYSNGTQVSQHELLCTKKTKVGRILPRFFCVGGQYQAQISPETNTPIPGAVTISPTRGFSGSLCEVRVWSVAKTADRVSSLIGRGKVSGVELDLIALLPLEEGFGLRVHDAAIVKNTVRGVDTISLVGSYHWESFPLTPDVETYMDLLSINYSESTMLSSTAKDSIVEVGSLLSRSTAAFTLSGHSSPLKAAEISGSRRERGASSLSLSLFDSLIAAVSVKLIAGCDKYLSTYTNPLDSAMLKKFKPNMPQLKSVLDPCDLTLMLINSLLRQVAATLNTPRDSSLGSDDDDNASRCCLFSSLSKALFAVLQVNVKVLCGNNNSMHSNIAAHSSTSSEGSSSDTSTTTADVFTSLLISLLGFVSGVGVNTLLPAATIDSLRRSAVTTIVSGIDAYIPQKANQFFALECLCFKRCDDRKALMTGVPVHQEIFSLLMSAAPLSGEWSGHRSGHSVHAAAAAVFPQDPLVSLMSMTRAGDDALLSALCVLMSPPAFITQILPNSLRPAVIPAVDNGSTWTAKGTDLTPLSSEDVVPVPGDQVQRGPHWKYGDQDGGSSGSAVGIVVGTGKWLSDSSQSLDHCSSKVVVQWKNGHINSYRYGVVTPIDSLDGKASKVFDVSVLRPVAKSTASSASLSPKPDSGNADLPIEVVVQSERRALLYTPEEVTSALLESRGGSTVTGITKRSILSYVKETAPLEWQEKFNLLRSSNSLFMKLNDNDIARIYGEFYKTFSHTLQSDLFCVSQPPQPSRLKLEPRSLSRMRTHKHFYLAERFSLVLSILLTDLVAAGARQYAALELNEDVGGSFQFVLAIHSALVGLYEPASISSVRSSNVFMEDYVVDTVKAADRIIRGSFRGKNGDMMAWDWQRGLWCKVEGAAKSDKMDHLLSANSNVTPKSNAGAAAAADTSVSKKILIDLSIDKNYLGGNLFIKNRIRSVEVIQSGDREWNTCICSTALHPCTGVYQWYVKIKNFSERRGHCMIGVATSDFSYDEFLGQHQESWGLSPNLDLFHGGRKRKSESEKKLSIGCIVEVTLDTDRGTISFAEVSADSNAKTIEPLGFDNVRGVVVYPAFSLYSPGDCISIFTNMEDVRSLRSSRGSAGKLELSPLAAVVKRQVVMLGDPQPIVIKYCLELISRAADVLTHAADVTATTHESAWVVHLYKHPVLSLLLPHMLSSLSKWRAVSQRDSKAMVDALVLLLEKLHAGINLIRGHDLSSGSSSSSEEQGQEDEQAGRQRSDELLVQLTCVTATFLGCIAKTWIKGKTFCVDNEERAKEWLNDVVEGEATVMTIQMQMMDAPPAPMDSVGMLKYNADAQKWLANRLFSQGMRGGASTSTSSRSSSSSGHATSDLLIGYGSSTVIADDDLFLRWIIIHDKTHKNYQRFGGDVLLHPVRMLFSANIHHTGYWHCTNYLYGQFIQFVKSIENEQSIDDVLRSLKPPIFVLQNWETAMKIRVWARELVSTGLSYEFIASRITRRSSFMLEFESCTGDQSFEYRHDQDFTQWVLSFPSEANKTSPSSSSSYHAIEKHISLISNTTKSFVMDSKIDLTHLRDAVRRNTKKAELRCDGFKAVRAALGHISEVIGCGAKCALITALPSAVRSSDDSSDTITSTTSSSSSLGNNCSHYLAGLSGISQGLRLELQGSFDSYYACLSEELASCNYAEDCIYQLCTLDCLGIRILQQDHTMLSRVNFFFTLQEILDNSLALISDSVVTPVKPVSSKLSAAESFNPNKIVVKAAMKLFILMALQVASCVDEDLVASSLSGASLSNSRSLSSQSMPPLPISSTATVTGDFQAPSLRKTKSGPATLSKSVFDIIFTQLDAVCKAAFSMAKSLKSAENFLPTIFISQSAHLITTEATTLLLCISKNAVCQQILSRPKWLVLFLQMSVLSSSVCQQRAILLLSDLLTSSSSSSSSSSSDLLSDLQLLDFDASCMPADFAPCFGPSHSPASTILHIFLCLIGNMFLAVGTSPIVCAEGSDFLKEVPETALPIIAEAVGLLRALYLTPSWHDLIETTFVGIMQQALRTTSLMTMSGGGDGEGDALLSKHILAVICVLGGHIEAPYRNCPVVFQLPLPSTATTAASSSAFSITQTSDNSSSSSSSSSKDLLIGVFVDFLDSSEKVQVSYYKAEDSSSSSGLDRVGLLHLLTPSTATLPIDKVHVVNRCPIQKLHLVISDDIISLAIQFMNTYALGKSYASTVATNQRSSAVEESKVEITALLQESKHNDDDAETIRRDSSFTADLSQLLAVMSTRVITTLASNAPSLDKLLSVLKMKSHPIADTAALFLYNLLDESQKPNKSGGLSDLSVYEEYMMIAIRQRQRLWTSSKQSQHDEMLKKRNSSSMQLSEELLPKGLNDKPRSSLVSVTSEQRPLDSNASDAATELGSICGSNFAENKTSERSSSPLPIPPSTSRRRNAQAALVQQSSGSEPWQRDSIDDRDEGYEFSSFNEVEGEDDSMHHQYLVESLCNMGFPPRWCELALDMCGGDPEEALNYILSNSMQLEEMTSSMAAEDEHEDMGDDDDDAEEAQPDNPSDRPSIPHPRDIWMDSSSKGGESTRAESDESVQEESEEHIVIMEQQQQSSAHQAEEANDHLMFNTITSPDIGPEIGHYDPMFTKLLPFYAQPSYDSERLGCIYPGDDVTILQTLHDPASPARVWFKLCYSDYEDGHFSSQQSSLFNEEDININDLFVWLPKFIDGVEAVKEGPYEGDLEVELSNTHDQSITIDRLYKVIGPNGALAREDIEIGSSEVMSIKTGEVVHACEETFNSEGTVRLRIDKPVRGWISKIFGLVQLMSVTSTGTEGNRTAAEGTTTTTAAVEVVDKKEEQVKPKASEVDLLGGIDDNMELFSANDAYNRNDRFFGSMQGSQYIKFRDRERAIAQSLYSRRMRISGMTSHHNYSQGLSNQPIRNIDDCIDSLFGTIQKLYCRKILLALLIRDFRSGVAVTDNASSSSSSIPSRLDPCNVFDLLLSNIGGSSQAEALLDSRQESIACDAASLSLKFYNFMRLVVFRGEPYSYTGLELLGFSDLFGVANESSSISIEQVFDRVLWTIMSTTTTATTTTAVNASSSSPSQGVEPANYRSITIPFTSMLVESIAKNIRLAAAPRFCDHVWADSSYEEDLDNDIMEQPNLHYACWITRILLLLLRRSDKNTMLAVVRCWSKGLRASSISMKHIVFNTLIDILTHVRQQLHSSTSDKRDEPASRLLLQACVSLVPIDRLVMLGTKRLWAEMEDSPAFSRFLQSLIHLLSEVGICNNSLKLLDAANENGVVSSVDANPSEEAVVCESKSMKERTVIRFRESDLSAGSSSYIQLSPQKELAGPWTVEFWLLRVAPSAESEGSTCVVSAVNSNDYEALDPPEEEEEEDDSEENRLRRNISASLGFPDKFEHMNDVIRAELINAASLNVSGRDSKLGITGLLNLLLGSGKGSSQKATKAPAKKSTVSTTPLDGKNNISPSCLLSSSKGCIKIQAGGRVFGVSKPISTLPVPDFEDPQQPSDPVHEEAYCVSIAPSGSAEKKFDCVVPVDRWVHLAIVCQVTPSSSITLYMDGEPRDTLPMGMSLPLSVVGSLTPGTSFCGDIAEMRVWNIARSKLELQRDATVDVSNARKLISHLKCLEGDGVLTFDKVGIFNSCKMSNCEWVRVAAPVFSSTDYPSFMINDSEEAEGLFGSHVGTGANVVEMTGVLKIPAVFAAQGEFSHDSSEVVCLCYREVNDSSSNDAMIPRAVDERDSRGVIRIEGFLEWCERDVRSRITGTLSADGSIAFSISSNSVVLGPPESLEFLSSVQFQGTLVDGQIKGGLTMGLLVDTLPPVEPGCSRIDQLSLPPEVKYFASVRATVMAHLMVKENAAEGQYVVTVEVCPYPKVMATQGSSRSRGGGGGGGRAVPEASERYLNDLTQEIESISSASPLSLIRATSTASNVTLEGDDDTELQRLLMDVEVFGICSDQGSIWVEWMLNANCGNVGFGLCTSDALLHPDACVDANDDTWTYNNEGQASNGSNLCLCDTAEEGDRISMHVDSDKGIVHFYKNYCFLVGFDNLKDHPKMKLSAGLPSLSDESFPPVMAIPTITGDPNSFRPGLRPFVHLVAPGDSVSYLGLKEGSVDVRYGDDDPLRRKGFYCQLVHGAFHGYSLTTLRDSTKHIFGNWHQGKEDGLHIELEEAADLETHVAVAAKKFEYGNLVDELSPMEISASTEVNAALAVYKKFVTQRLSAAAVAAAAVTDADETAAENRPTGGSPRTADVMRADALAAQFAQMQSSSKITIVLRDSSGENSYFKVMRGIVAKKLFSAYASKRDVPMRSFVFKHGTVTIEPQRSIESYRIGNNAVIEVSVHSVKSSSAIGDGGMERKTEIEKYITESSAPYVLLIIYESGALVRSGIEIESSSLRTLSHGEVIEAFSKSYSSEGVGRYRVADGWISEKLRGGSEEMVVRVLHEKFASAVHYRVVREEGARVRQQPSLLSDDVGFCPFGTVLTAVESRYVPSGLAELDGTSVGSSTVRIRIASPAAWQGWASVKDHILEKVSDSEVTDGDKASVRAVDPAIIAEKERRNRIRTQRKSKVEAKLKQDSTKKRRKLVTASAALDVSQETFFLLKRRNRVTGGSHPQISTDFATVSCDSSSQGRAMVLGTRGFTRGVHYWEVQVNASSWGSVFIGVAPGESNSWNGYGLLNYRATQAFGSETLYGSYFSVNDRVGVLLDMDHGTISFIKDGEDFNLGRMNVINMGVAYHNLRRMGTRSANSVLYPCFGVKMNGDELSIRKQHWISSRGLSPASLMERVIQARKVLHDWNQSYLAPPMKLPPDLVHNMFEAHQAWSDTATCVITTRPGIKISISTGQLAVEKAAGKLASSLDIRVGKTVKTQYGPGKVLGARCNQLWYCYEGGEQSAWYWRTDELQDLCDAGHIKFEATTDEETTPGTDEAAGVVADKMIGLLDQHEMSRDEFVDGMIQPSRAWTAEDDAIICRLVNYIANKYDMDPYRIPAASIKEHISSRDGLLQGRADMEVQARYSALCVLNRAASAVLPLVDFNHGDNRLQMVTTTIREFNISSMSPTTKTNADPSSSGYLIHQLKRAIFTQTKEQVWSLAIKESTTPTAAPPDEYERPDDLREISINRVEARNAEKSKDHLSLPERLKVSVFGQLLSSMMSWDDRSLRRAYVHMQDAGQKRAFFVKFTGEGVDDQGGPYRAVFQTAVGEETTQLLNLLVPCPNALSEIGENRDKYTFNTELLNAMQNNNSTVYVHLGKLIALACRHQILVPLSLPKLIWKPLVGEPVDVKDLLAVDVTVANSLNSICSSFPASGASKKEVADVAELLIQALLGSSSPYSSQGVHSLVCTALGVGLEKDSQLQGEQEVEVDRSRYDVVQDIVRLVQQMHLTAQSKGLKHVYKGISAVVPVELISMFTAEELEGIFCGEAEVDLTILRKATIYESVSIHDSHIQHFWEAVQCLSPEEKSLLVNFCSGRSRLPASAGDFPMNFKLTTPPVHSEKNPDDYLPIARTCFFSLSLPKYSSVKICLDKLRYAIRNTELMDADFIDRKGTSGWENVR